MANKLLALGLLLMWSFPSLGQNDSTQTRSSRAIRYSNSLLMGGLFADDHDGNSLSLSMNHGIRYKEVFAGVGAGYDTYEGWNVVPVYIIVTIDLANVKSNAFYVSLSGGYSNAWSNSEGRPNGSMYEYEEHGRGNFNAMVGYRIQANQYRIYISGGYKFQRIQYKTHYDWWYDYAPSNTTEVKMDLNRLVIQIGFGFN